MRLSSVYSARTAWMLDTDELNPLGARLFPRLAVELAQHFEFINSPQTPEQFNYEAATGIRFDDGSFTTDEGIVSARFEIHKAGLAVETRCSTSASEEILHQIVQWSVKEFGVNFTPSRIRRTIYISQLVVYIDKDISKGLAKLYEFGGLLSDVAINGNKQNRQPTALVFRGEGESRAAFTFERRTDSPFDENKYFSLCDVPTNVHLELIERFESLMAD